jgi:hypothetical protein
MPSMTNEQPLVKYTQSFKKYRAEYRPDVVAFVKDWAKQQKLFEVYEDASVFKVTGSKEQIDGLRATLKEKFGWEPLGPSG